MKRTLVFIPNAARLSRRQVFERICHLASPIMPFSNLPDKHKSRWGDELTAEKMKECIWLRPEAVAQIEFLEWTAGERLRDAKFVGLPEDKNPQSVIKEMGGEKRIAVGSFRIECSLGGLP